MGLNPCGGGRGRYLGGELQTCRTEAAAGKGAAQMEVPIIKRGRDVITFPRGNLRILRPRS